MDQRERHLRSLRRGSGLTCAQLGHPSGLVDASPMGGVTSEGGADLDASRSVEIA
jgi:hypothetical protein